MKMFTGLAVFTYSLFSAVFSIAARENLSFSQQNNNGEAIVEVFVPSGQSILFNYWNETNVIQKLEFNNTSKTDSVVIKRIHLIRPTHFTRGVFFKSTVTNKFVTRIYNYLIMPGDTLRLKADRIVLNKIYYSGGSLQLDEIFWIPSDFDEDVERLQEIQKTGYSPGFDPYRYDILKRIDDSANHSLGIIDSLYQRRLLSNEYYKALKKFNKLNRNNSIVVYGSFYTKLSETFKAMYDSIDAWSGIASRMNNNVLGFIFKYGSNSKTDEAKWQPFLTLPQNIKLKSVIADYLLYKLGTDRIVKNKDSLKSQIEVFIRSGFSARQLQEYYSNYLLSENLKSNTDANLININGDSLRFQPLMASLQGKYVFIDIWASWCTPCFGQMPYVRKVEEELKNENIVFISISADKDEQNANWLEASKKLSLSQHKYNFRFRQGFKNQYLEVNQITSVPRYLLFNPNGEIIDSDFIQPNDQKFKSQLLAYLKK